jgi:heme A synthase
MTMAGGTGREPGETGTGGSAVAGRVVAGGIALALVVMAYLHVTGSATVDPVDATISDYVRLPGGYVLLALAAFALAAGAVALAAGLSPAGLPDAGPPVGVLLSGSAALVLVGLFPTNAPDTPAGVVANLHRVAGGWVFAALPLAGWMVARRARLAPGWRSFAPLLTGVAGATGVLSAVFLLSHLPIVIGTSPGFPLLGGVERVLYASMMLVLLVTGRATRLAVDGVRNTSGVALGDPDTGHPADIGRVA